MLGSLCYVALFPPKTAWFSNGWEVKWSTCRWQVWSNSLRSLWSIAVITAIWSKNPTNLPNQRFGVGARNLGVRFARLKINPLAICAAYFIAPATSYFAGILHKSRKGFISLKERHIWMYQMCRSFLSAHNINDTKQKMCYRKCKCAIENANVLFGLGMCYRKCKCAILKNHFSFSKHTLFFGHVKFTNNSGWLFSNRLNLRTSL